MIKASFQAAFGKAHNPEYQFFREYNSVTGSAIIVGYNGGQPITSLRIYNQSLRIILFEKDVFLEETVKKAKWVLRQEFDYHITALGEMQEAQTLFVPKRNNKIVKEEATFMQHEVAHLIEKGEVLRDSKRKPDDDDGDSEHFTSSVFRRNKKETEPDTNPFVKQIGFISQPLDNFKLNPEVIIIEDEEINPSFLPGAFRTLNRRKATIMVPNTFPLRIEAGTYLAERNYHPYHYDPKADTLFPFNDDANSKSVIFIHESVFLSDKPVKLWP